MRQARIFCPFLRHLEDDKFEISLHKNNLKNAKQKFKEFYNIRWEERPRLRDNL